MWPPSAVFCIFVLPILNVETFKFGDDGVCIAKISVPKTRTKLVTLNKWCGKKKCVVKKAERYKETVEKAVCCNGWEYSVDKDICTPICRTGCVGGRCVAPEVCHCDPPSTLDPAHKNTCIKPKCDDPCVNSDCINHTCICHRGFTKYNTTHCHKCDSGFFLSDDFDCLPICDNPCLNGKCTAPDTCTCLDGYAQKDNITCEPICNCINATCVAPNKCLCFEGYMNLNESTCVPQCDDCDGECVEPNVCKCKEGYSSFNGTCKPSCEKCESGECLKTGLCREEDADRNETANNLKNNLCKTTVTEDGFSVPLAWDPVFPLMKNPKQTINCVKRNNKIPN